MKIQQRFLIATAILIALILIVSACISYWLGNVLRADLSAAILPAYKILVAITIIVCIALFAYWAFLVAQDIRK